MRFLNLFKDATFEFTETNTGDGYEFVKAELEGDETSTAKVTGTVKEANHTYTVEYTNKAVRKPVKFLKKDGTKEKWLDGASFELLQIKDGHEIQMYFNADNEAFTQDQVLTAYNYQHPEAEPATEITDAILSEMGFQKEFTIDNGETGKVLNIPYGPSYQYKLKEINAPDGYIVLGEITFKLDQNGNVQEASPADAVLVTDKTDTDPAQVVVYNTPGTPLPNTGGPGTAAYTLGGMILLIGSVLLYGFRMRHEGRRCG